MGHQHGAIKVASSVIIRFKDQPTAEAAYRADIFQQSKLNGQPGTILGNETGLGPNAVVGFDANAMVSYQAVWQKGPFNAYFLAQNLSREESYSAASAENSRMTNSKTQSSGQ